MTTDSSFLFPLQLRSDFCSGAAECCCAQPGSMARARLVNGMSLTAVSPLPTFKTQYLTGGIPQGRKSRAGRKHILLKINGGDVFITLQLNCTNLCTAVCESRLGWAARVLFPGTQLPVLSGWGLCGVQGCLELHSPSLWEGKK